MSFAPALYIVASPIGNLQDITLRAIEVLKNVNIIYAEDTRVSRILCQKYGITTPLKSYREAADRFVVDRTIADIIAELKKGHSVAYLSDAGTPGVSDPGDYLVHKVVEAGFSLYPIPGSSALTALLSVAGLAVARPLFAGFLPRKKGRHTLLTQLNAALESGVTDGIVIYESPARILATLGELTAWSGSYRVCLGRELTKQFEEIIRGTLSEVILVLEAKKIIKGEIVFLITPHV